MSFLEVNAVDPNKNKKAVTFSVWVKADTYMLGGWPRLIAVFQDMNEATDENEVVEIECPVPRSGSGSIATFTSGFVGDSNTVLKEQMQMSAFGGTWHHYAFVRDTDANLMLIYHNGEKIAETNQTTSPMFGKGHPIESFRIAKRRPGPYPHTGENNKIYTDASWTGRINDFRVYNYALSQAEVAWLMGLRSNPSYVPSPFKNVANFKSSTPDMIDFGDFAILVKDWLNQQWWP